MSPFRLGPAENKKHPGSFTRMFFRAEKNLADLIFNNSGEYDASCDSKQ
jgi:hypothetical protein